MRRNVFGGVLNRIVAAGLAAAMLAAAGASASVDVHGSIGDAADAGPVQVSLAPAPSLHELFSAVLNDDLNGLFPVEATVDVVNGRFTFEVDEPGVRWVRARSAGAGEWAFLLVGPETNTLLPPHDLKKLAFCTVSLKNPSSAWIVRGGSLRDFGHARSWTVWPPIRRIEAGRPARHEFGGRIVSSRSGLRRFEVLTIGAPGYEAEVVECEAGADLAVELKRPTAPAVSGVLRRNGVPERSAILVGENGWPAGATDERGRFRALAGVYHVLTADGGLDAVEHVAGVADLIGSARPPVAVSHGRSLSRSEETARWAAVHWSSAGALLALDGGRLTGGLLMAKGPPGAARTNVLAERFAPLEIDWASPPVALSLEPLLRLEGTVADPAGAGVGGASVSINGTGARPVAWSDGAGRFSLEVFESPGQGQLVARAAGYGEARRDLSEVRGAGRQPILLELVPHRTIRGRLVAAAGGGIRGTVGLAGPWDSERFIGDAALWNVGDDPTLLQVVSTEDDGEFALDPAGARDGWLVAAAPGSYSVAARSDNMEGPRVEVEVAAGEAPYVELTGPGAGLLRVTVRGLTPSEAGKVSLMVETIRPSGGMSGRRMHAATGGTATAPVFEMPFRQPDGTTTVIASVESTGRSRRAPLRMAAPGITEVELSFTEDTVLLEGAVTLDGLPLAGERVFVTDERQNLAWSVNTDHRGHFLIDGLRKGGEVALAAVGRQRRVRLAETTSRVDFDAYSASVRGWLLDAETGLAAAGMRVSAVPAWSAGGERRDADGAPASHDPHRGRRFLRDRRSVRGAVPVGDSARGKEPFDRTGRRLLGCRSERR